MIKAILIQARLSSSRFPQKMLHLINNITLLEYVYNRCLQSKQADEVMIITSVNQSDDELYELCLKKKIPVFRGSLNNVLERYLESALFIKADVVCRVCGDSPFVDVNVIDNFFDLLEKNRKLEYICASDSLNGFISEVFTLNVLKELNDKKLSNEDKEHVTKYIIDNIEKYNYKKIDLKLRPIDLENFTLTVDYPDDLETANKIAKELDNFNFNSSDVIKTLYKIKGIK